MGNLKIRDLVSNAIFPPPFETVEYQINNRVIIPSMELREIIVEKYKKDGLKMIDYYLNFPYLAAPSIAIEIEIYVSSRLNK